MANKRFKALVKASLVTLISLSLIYSLYGRERLDATVAQPSTPSISGSLATQPSSSQSQEIWGCNAGNGKQKYVVDQLNRNSDNFDMAIYNGVSNDIYGEEAGNYVGTVQVNVTQKGSGVEVIGRGQTSNSTVEVNAFGRTPHFSVRDSVNGQASGRCYLQWQMADNETRRLVRECLAFAARKFRHLAQVSQTACIGNPSSYLEELKRQ